MEPQAAPSRAGQKPKKKRKIAIYALVAIVIVVMLIAAMVLFAPKVQITSARQNFVTTIHFQDGKVAYFNDSMYIKNPIGGYALGQDIVLKMTYTNPNASNMVNITGFTANAPGFAFKSCTPELPINDLPVPPGGTTVELRFSAPSSAWSGQFELTVYFEQYPLN